MITAQSLRGDSNKETGKNGSFMGDTDDLDFIDVEFADSGTAK